MGILKSVFGGQKPKYELLGNTEAICPYCGKHLDKMPGHKKKCPSCGNFMFIRTRPADQKRVVVTEQDAVKIDEQWMKENGTYEAYLARKEEFEEQKAELARKWGHEPSDSDVSWALYNKDLLRHAANHDWGLYRVTRYEMAELLRKDKRDQLALDTYLEVSYLDANGPNNVGGITDPKLLREFPPFSHAMAFQAPSVVKHIQMLAKSLAMSDKDLEGTFMNVAERVYANMKLPVSPKAAWADLKPELQKASS